MSSEPTPAVTSLTQFIEKNLGKKTWEHFIFDLLVHVGNLTSHISSHEAERLATIFLLKRASAQLKKENPTSAEYTNLEVLLDSYKR